MYQNFDLIKTVSNGSAESGKEERRKLVGYLWDVKAPKSVMCIIHGIGEHAGRYDRMAGYLNAAEIAVISMDLRGHGLSDGKYGHTAPREEVLDEVSMMIDKAKELYPNVPIILYGHSMGGNICLDYRCRGSENDVPEKYIVSGPWLKLVKGFPKFLVSIVGRIANVFPELQLSSGCEAKDLGNIEITAGYDTDPLVHTTITLATAMDCMSIAEDLLSGKHPDNGRAKGKPFLLMHGNQDKICSVEGSRLFAETHKNDANFTYIEWDGYYHEIHNGGPEVTGEKVIETIRDFVLA